MRVFLEKKTLKDALGSTQRIWVGRHPHLKTPPLLDGSSHEGARPEIHSPALAPLLREGRMVYDKKKPRVVEVGSLSPGLGADNASVEIS